MLRKVKSLMIADGKIEAVLGANTSFNGHLKTDGNIRVEGLYEGVIETLGNVIIGETAKVSADIIAHSVQVWGMVAGSIKASDRLEILPTGRVFADIVVKSLLIDDGGVFRGQCTIQGLDTSPPTEGTERSEENGQSREETKGALAGPLPGGSQTHQKQES